MRVIKRLGVNARYPISREAHRQLQGWKGGMRDSVLCKRRRARSYLAFTNGINGKAPARLKAAQILPLGKRTKKEIQHRHHKKNKAYRKIITQHAVSICFIKFGPKFGLTRHRGLS